jgi:hypothetical protein
MHGTWFVADTTASSAASSPWASALGALGTLLVGAVSGWLGAYLKVTAEGRATREQFDEKLKQLRESTYAEAEARVKGETQALSDNLDQKLEQLRHNTATVEDVKRAAEDNARRLSNSAAYVERQIEEFYGPLYNVVQQVIIANHVQHRIIHGESSSPTQLPRAKEPEVRRFFQERYFFPLHAQINNILRSKLYLIEGTRMPESFYLYLQHALQEEAQANLWYEHNIDTRFLPGEPYPNDFQRDVRRHLDVLMDRYESLAAAPRNAQ